MSIIVLLNRLLLCVHLQGDARGPAAVGSHPRRAHADAHAGTAHGFLLTVVCSFHIAVLDSSAQCARPIFRVDLNGAVAAPLDPCLASSRGVLSGASMMTVFSVRCVQVLDGSVSKSLGELVLPVVQVSC